jgi:hypothetical protein
LEQYRLVSREIVGDGLDHLGRAVAVDGDVVLLGANEGPSSRPLTGRAEFYDARELRLEIDPDTVRVGDTAAFTVLCGKIDAALLLVVTDVGGVPFFLPVVSGKIGPDHMWDLEAIVPGGFTGIDARFIVFGESYAGQVVATNEATLSFQ